MTAFVGLVYAMLQLSSGPTPRADVRVSGVDSSRLVRSARSAQSSFEAFRRRHLPIAATGSGWCDVHVGRYCYWRADEDAEHRPAEDPSIARRRDELIRVLDSTSRVVPGDAWIAGQDVRYLVEADRANDAIRFAGTECRASASWCAALAGFAAHSASRFATADSAFAVALEAMKPDERCRWLDISELVDDATAKRFDALDCDARVAFARRLLRLAAPLYSVSATDLYTEHLARVTRSRIGDGSANVEEGAWGDDQWKLTIRYGWPRWFTRSLPSSSSLYETSSITGHDGLPYNFLPSGEALRRLAHLTTADWALEDARALTGYAPLYARSLHDLPSQLAVFRRGDSTLIIGAWDARRDTTLLGRALVAAVALAGDSGSMVMARDTSAKTVGRIAGTGVIDSGLVSLELLAASDHRAARVRVGLPPRGSGRLALSSLLLYAPSTEPAFNIAAVKDSALASSIIPASRSVGVYWESYGVRDGGEPVHFSLTVEQVGVSWARRAAARFHLADPTTSLRLQWDEVAQPDQHIAGRGVRVDLSRLRGGRYVITLDVSARDGALASSAKEIVVR